MVGNKKLTSTGVVVKRLGPNKMQKTKDSTTIEQKMKNSISLFLVDSHSSSLLVKLQRCSKNSKSELELESKNKIPMARRRHQQQHRRSFFIDTDYLWIGRPSEILLRILDFNFFILI